MLVMLTPLPRHGAAMPRRRRYAACHATTPRCHDYRYAALPPRAFAMLRYERHARLRYAR